MFENKNILLTELFPPGIQVENSNIVQKEELVQNIVKNIYINVYW